jgi:alpha/beta superfamily hydrolase
LNERLRIAGPAGVLEAIVEDPGDSGGPSYAVICHPHPLYGGTMDNKVVTTLARALLDAGVATVRFNFRGVMLSTGAYDHGVGEIADAAAVASWGELRWPGKTLIIAGFSFGGYVALRLASQRTTARLITVAPAIGMFGAEISATPDCPWLIVQGDADDVVNPKAVIAWAAPGRSSRGGPLFPRPPARAAQCRE